jgi:hypothetical protein
MNNLTKSQPTFDLAGFCTPQLHYLQTRARINRLVDRYISPEILTAHLQDLPKQFEAPHQRPWQTIHWNDIQKDQIVGVDPALFLSVLASSVEIETPIREYSKESWHFFKTTHPQMAYFMGGVRDENGKILEVSEWEKEERQHAPVFSKIYEKLTGIKLCPIANSVQDHSSTENPIYEVYNHVLSRIGTEWSAVSIYLWLMVHSTGELQNAIAQPLKDEINHLAKFWGFASWAFQDSFATRVRHISGQMLALFQHHRHERSQSNEILQNHGLFPAIELAFTFTRILAQLHQWNRQLHIAKLDPLFA